MARVGIGGKEGRMAASDSMPPNLYREALEKPLAGRAAISRTAFQKTLSVFEAAADFLVAAFGIFLANWLYFSLHIGKHIHYRPRQVGSVAAIVGLFVVLLLQMDGAYRSGGNMLHIRETERAIRIPVQALILLLPFSFLLNLYFSRAAFLIGFILVPLLLALQKQAVSQMVCTLHGRGYGVERVVVYGANEAAERIVSTLKYSPRLGLQPVAVIDDNPLRPGSRSFALAHWHRGSIPVKRVSVTDELLRSCDAGLLILATPNLSAEKLEVAAHAARLAGMRVAFLHGPEVQAWQGTESIDIDGLLLTSIVDPVVPWHYAAAKRAVDLVLSALLLLLLAPWLLLIALLIRFDSPGPALFIQKRVGRNGRVFDMYKFRTMRADTAKYDLSPTTPHDGRITRIGRYLRRTSLDELPQLLNVLRGNMSLVGPRPEMPFIVQGYTQRHRQRHQVMPGITGLWQLSADRAFQIHENIQYDLYYIRNRTFFMDVAILIHTLFFAMRGI